MIVIFRNQRRMRAVHLVGAAAAALLSLTACLGASQGKKTQLALNITWPKPWLQSESRTAWLTTAEETTEHDLSMSLRVASPNGFETLREVSPGDKVLLDVPEGQLDVSLLLLTRLGDSAPESVCSRGAPRLLFSEAQATPIAGSGVTPVVLSLPNLIEVPEVPLALSVLDERGSALNGAKVRVAFGASRAPLRDT